MAVCCFALTLYLRCQHNFFAANDTLITGCTSHNTITVFCEPDDDPSVLVIDVSFLVVSISHIYADPSGEYDVETLSPRVRDEIPNTSLDLVAGNSNMEAELPPRTDKPSMPGFLIL